MDIAALLTADTRSSDDGDLIAKHDETFPLNRELLKPRTRPSGSQRVRLRRVIESLREKGVEVSGVEPSQKRPDATVRFSGQFDRYGTLHQQLEVHIDANADFVPTATLVQAALQEQGFNALVEANQVVVLHDRQVISETDLAWAALGVLRDRDRSGLNPEDVEPWIAAHEAFRALYAIHDWRDAGYTPHEAAQWVEVDAAFRTFAYARKWIEADATPDDARPWLQASAGLYDYTYVRRWVDAGLTPEHAAVWSRVPGFCTHLQGDIATARRFADAGFTCAKIAEMCTTGWEAKDFEEAVKLIDAGADSRELREWIAFGSKFVRNHALSWVRARQKPTDAKPWFELGYSNLVRWDHASKWMQMGIDPQEAARWANIHYRFENADLARTWMEAGLTHADAARWVKHNPSHWEADADFLNATVVRAWMNCHPACEDPAIASKLADANVTPKQVKLIQDLLGVGCEQPQTT